MFRTAQNLIRSSLILGRKYRRYDHHEEDHYQEQIDLIIVQLISCKLRIISKWYLYMFRHLIDFLLNFRIFIQILNIFPVCSIYILRIIFTDI